MRILGIDIGTKTGWTTMERDENGFHIDGSNVYDTKKTMEIHGSAGRWCMFWNLLEERGPGCDYICYEHVPPNVHSGSVAARVHGGLLGLLEMWAFKNEIEMVPISIQATKFALTGSKAATKEMMVTAAKKRFPGTPIVKHDQADAIGVCLAGLEELWRT